MAGRTKDSITPFYKYRRSAPEVKAAVADRLREVERDAFIPAIRASRCCGRCKTPYNCGNAGCACHSGDRVRTMLDN